MVYDVAIIGAGASGLMTASLLHSQRVCIIDSNPNIGAKIKVSGGGKCNITNQYLDGSKYLGDTAFIENIFSKFTQNDLLKFLNSHGVFPKIDEKIVLGTYFCNSSKEVIDLFEKLIYKVHKKLSTKVVDISTSNDVFTIETTKGSILAKKVVVATGGLSYAQLGSSDIGYKIAQKFGHTIAKLDPALVGFTVQKDQFWFKHLSGLSIDAKITVQDKKLEGKLLFTHKGCSGPVVLSASLYWQKGNISIDFAPKKTSYLPKRFKQAIKEIPDFDLHNYTMAPAGNFGYAKAEVTKGGVKTAQLSDFLESKLCKNLYFIGEVVDVTGELGGYNFQWSFSSAYCCAMQLNR